MSKLKVTLIQTTIHWHNAVANRNLFEQKLPECGASDLVILPEMYATGFTMDAPQQSEPMNGATLAWQRQQSLSKNYFIAGSLAIDANGRYVNRFCLTSPNGNINYYDKRHGFRIAGENEHYDSGIERSILPVHDWWMQPQICYDLRFPVFCRNGKRPEARMDRPELLYDILVVIANWPAARRLHWSTLLRARAIENQCFVIGLNRIGVDGNGVEYSGDSVVIGPEGDCILDMQEFDSIKTITLDRDALWSYRRRFPVWYDADNIAAIYD